MQGGLGLKFRAKTADAPDRLSLPAARAWALANLPLVATLVALGTGISVRAFYVLRESFPVNDGGMFYVMARDIQNASYGIPKFSSYNGGEVPFVYPPLTLYAAAIGDALTPASLLDMFWILPLAGTIFALWAVYRLASAVLSDRWSVVAATLAFALAPRSFIWLLMGGGLPRAFGLAFVMLAVREAYLLTTGEASRRRTVMAAVFVALTAMTHLETAAFLALTFVLVALVRPSVGIRRVGIAGLLGSALAAPWLLAMIAVHGIEPFLAGSNEGGRLMADGQISIDWIRDFAYSPVHTSEPYFPLIGALGVIGAVYSFARGQWFLPVWWIVIGIVGMRAFPTYVTVATCLLAGVAIGQLVLPGVVRHLRANPRWRPVLTTAAAGGFCLWFSVTSALTIDRGEIGMYMESLAPADRTAMEWVDERLPEDALFAVVPVQIWPGDYPSEWFPAIADRVSRTTPQGYEWVDGEFEDRTVLHQQLLNCSYQPASCIEQRLRGTGVEYVYVPSNCCRLLKNSMRHSASFDVVYDRGGPMIAKRTGSTAIFD